MYLGLHLDQRLVAKVHQDEKAEPHTTTNVLVTGTQISSVDRQASSPQNHY
jgi:hypothetical protein